MSENHSGIALYITYSIDNIQLRQGKPSLACKWMAVFALQRVPRVICPTGQKVAKRYDFHYIKQEFLIPLLFSASLPCGDSSNAKAPVQCRRLLFTREHSTITVNVFSVTDTCCYDRTRSMVSMLMFDFSPMGLRIPSKGFYTPCINHFHNN
jgi:hypothetical protein